jgi:tetratricopeptide (TPR) repeat protein
MTPHPIDPADPPRTGRLEVLPLPNLIYRLYRNEVTGTLRLESSLYQHSVDFAKGLPAAVTLVGDSVEPLGRILLELGKIGEDDYQVSLQRLADTRRLHGQILREMGAISESDLELGLQVQLRRKLNRLFQLTEGSFEFEPKTEVSLAAMPVNPLPVIFHGIRNAYDEERLERLLLPLVGLEIRIRPGFNERDLELDLSAGERAFLVHLGEFRSFGELTSGSVLPPFEARLMLACLLLTEALDFQDAIAAWGAASGARAQPAPPTNAVETTPPAGSEPEEIPRAETPTEGEAGEKERDERREAQGSPRTAPEAKPPRASRASPEARARETTTAATAKVAARPQLTTSEVLRRAEKRGVPKAGPAEPLDEDLAALIAEKEKQIDGSHFFTVLDVPRNATLQEIKQSYFLLAKRFHPDRFLSPKLRGLRRRAETIFERVSEAYDSLRSEDKRQEYLALLADERLRGDRKRSQMVAQADTQFTAAEEALARGDFATAEDLLRRAIDLFHDGADYYAALGWVTYQNPQSSKATRFTLAIKHLLKALGIKSDCVRAHLGLAKIYEAEEQPAAASRHYQKVLELEPGNAEAKSALQRFPGENGGSAR